MKKLLPLIAVGSLLVAALPITVFAISASIFHVTTGQNGTLETQIMASTLTGATIRTSSLSSISSSSMKTSSSLPPPGVSLRLWLHCGLFSQKAHLRCQQRLLTLSHLIVPLPSLPSTGQSQSFSSAFPTEKTMESQTDNGTTSVKTSITQSNDNGMTSIHTQSTAQSTVNVQVNGK